jgi:hypothetical protein
MYFGSIKKNEKIATDRGKETDECRETKKNDPTKFMLKMSPPPFPGLGTG